MDLDIVSYFQAKELKKFGFQPEDDCSYLYLNGELMSQEEYFEMDCGGPFSAELADYEKIYAPRIELVTKWLRKEKGIDILPFRNSNSTGVYSSTYSLKLVLNYYGSLENCGWCCGQIFNTFEEALITGIDKAIEILNYYEN